MFIFVHTQLLLGFSNKCLSTIHIDILFFLVGTKDGELTPFDNEVYLHTVIFFHTVTGKLICNRICEWVFQIKIFLQTNTKILKFENIQIFFQISRKNAQICLF